MPLPQTDAASSLALAGYEACSDDTQAREVGTPARERVTAAEVLRDLDAGRLADAVADGTLDERPWLVEEYRARRVEVAAARAAWDSHIDALLADRSPNGDRA